MHDTSDLTSLKLFAAIFLDGELQGGPLEGLSHVNVADSLINFLSDDQEKRQQPLSVESLQHMLRALTDLSIISQFQQKAVDTKLTADIISQKLEQQRDVFFPGGWTAKPHGHAMVYRLFYDKGVLTFLAYNTGEGGNQYHKQIAPGDLDRIPAVAYREKFNPVYAITFPNEQQRTHYGRLEAWVKKLIDPMVLPNQDAYYQDNNVDALYANIFPSSAYLGGELVDPAPYYPHVTAGQRSGTCAQYSVQKMLRTFFESDTDFDRFILDYRIYVLRDYLIHKKIPLSYQKEYRAAVENTARMITKGKDLEQQLSQDDKRQLLSELSTIQQKADAYFKQRIKPVVESRESEPHSNYKLKVPSLNWKPSAPASVFNRLASRLLKWHAPQHPSTLLFDKQGTLLQAIHQLEAESYKPDKRIFVHNIEQLCFTYCARLMNYQNKPFETPNATPEDWSKAIPLLHKYAIDYFHHYYKNGDNQYYKEWFGRKHTEEALYVDNPYGSSEVGLDKAASPRNQLMTLGLMCLFNYATIRYHASIHGLTQWDPALQPIDYYMAYLPIWLIDDELRKNCFISSTDPEMSALFTALNTYYDVQERRTILSIDFSESLLNYYGSLMQLPYFKDESSALESLFYKQKTRFDIDTKSEQKLIEKKALGLDLSMYSADRLKEIGVTYPRIKHLNQMKQMYLHGEYFLYFCLKGLQYGNHRPTTKDVDHLNFSTFWDSEKQDIGLQTSAGGMRSDPVYKIALSWYCPNYHENPHRNLHCYEPRKAYLMLQHRDLIKTAHGHEEDNVTPEILELMIDDISNPPRDSNAIRLLSKETERHKTLRHLRAALPLQAVQLLDYFTQHIYLLDECDNQLYLLLSLFQLSSLDQAFLHDADVLTALGRLYQKGIVLGDLAQDKTLTYRGLFLVKLSLWIYAYTLNSQASSMACKIAARERYALLNEDIQYWVKHNKAQPLQNELQRLTFYNLMHLYTTDELSIEQHRDVLIRLLSARVYIQDHKQDRIPGTTTLAEDESFEPLFINVLRINPDALSHAFSAVLTQLLPNQAPFTQQGHYHAEDNEYVCLDKNKQRIQLNLMDGRITQENQVYGYIPTPIINDSVAFQRIIGSEINPLAKIITKDEFEFHWQGHEYYFAPKGLFKRIQGAWYQYRDDAFLPEYLRNPHHDAWVSPTGQHALIMNHADDLSARESCLYEWKNGTLHSLGEMKGRVCFEGDAREQILTCFYLFEDSNLIEVVQCDPKEKGSYQFYLPRYQLKGQYDAENGISIIVDKVNYFVTSHLSPLKTGVMVSRSKTSKTTDCLLLTPIQQFYTNKEIDGAHYHLIHDLRRHLPETRIMSNKPYAVLHYDEFGKLRVLDDFSTDQLYLAYMYCARYEFDKAHAIIDCYLVQGKPEELQYIHWLSQKLPATQDEKLATKEAIATSSLLAIQLKALSLLSRFPQAPSVTDKLPEDSKKYLSSVEDDIIDKYEKYHRLSNNLSEDIKLNPRAIEILAEEAWLRLESKLRHAKAEVKRLSEQLSTSSSQVEALGLLAQINQLNQTIKDCKIKQTQGSLAFVHAKAPYFIGDKNTTALFSFNQTQGYGTQPLRIIRPESSYKPDEKRMSSLNDLREFIEQQSDKKSKYYADACHALTLDITDNDLFLNLKCYFSLMLDPDDLNDYRSKLQDYCDRTILACADLNDFYQNGGQSNDINQQVKSYNSRKDRFHIAVILRHALADPNGFRLAYSDVISRYKSQDLKKISMWHVISFSEKGFSDIALPITEPLLRMSITNQSSTVEIHKRKAILKSAETPRLPTGRIGFFAEDQHQAKPKDTGPLSFIAEKLCNLFEETEAKKQKIIHKYQALSPRERQAQHEEADKALDGIQLEYQHHINTLVSEQFKPTNKATSLQTIRHMLMHLVEDIVDHKQLLQHHASALPLNMQELLAFDAKQLGGKLKPLQTDRLLLQYALGIDADYLAKRNVSHEKIPQVRRALQQYLRTVFLYRQYGRILATLQQLQTNLSAKKLEELHLQLATQILELYPLPNNRPALDVFQYQTQKTVRQEQWALIKRFMAWPESNQDPSENNLAGQMIMGAGKTKVILPELAFLNADGEHLSIMEVPPPLLRTNYLDLKRTFKEVFGQELFLFEFDRDSLCDAVTLKRHLALFHNIILQRDCLIMASNSLQSLHLKWRELLYHAQKCPEGSAERIAVEEQIGLLKEILLLFKQRAYVVVDEIPKVLDINQELS
jgi:hypothetical protein